MTVVRLNQMMRDTIQSKVMAVRFDKLAQELQKGWQELGEFAYSQLISDHRKLGKLPKGWVPLQSSFHVYVGGYCHSFRMSKPRPIPYDVYNRDRRLQATSEVKEKLREWQEQEKKYKSDRETAIQQMRSVLYTVTTVGKLLEVWPEVKPFLPKGDAPITTALTVPIASMNTLLGLVKS